MLPGGAYALGEQPEPWLRGPATIDSDHLVLDRKRAVEWRPQVKAERVGRGDPIIELANASTRADAVRFVERFGLLRHGPEQSEWREPLADFQREANVLYRTLTLYRDVLNASIEPDGVRELRKTWQAEVDASTGIDFLDAAAVMVAALVTRGLDGVGERVLPVSDEHRLVFVAAARSPHLLGYIYHQFATLMTSGVRLRVCQDLECGRFFAPNDRRQRYCSPQHATRVRVGRSRAARREGDQV